MVAGNLFSTFCCLLIGALLFLGLIPMMAGVICLILAGIVGTACIYTDLIPARESKHKVAGTLFLWAVLIAIGIGGILGKNHLSTSQGCQATGPATANGDGSLANTGCNVKDLSTGQK